MQNPVTMPSQPQLGTPVPGTTGGLPSVSGLSVMQNPMAQQLQSMGRGEDSMLVHMTPGEVNSLQGLAMAAGGSLTINPVTGLPEAGFLKKLLPMLAGIGLNFILPGSGIVATLGGKAATAGLMVGAGTTALTGNLQKGLMAGLGAFGGASLAGGAEAALASGAKTGAAGVAAPPIPVADAAGQAAKLTVPGSVPGMTGTTLSPAMAKIAAQEATIQGGGINISPSLSKALAGPIKTPGTLGRFGQGFAETARGGMTGLAGKAAPLAAGMGVLSTVSDATAPQMPKYNPEEDEFEYTPMAPLIREVQYQTPEQMRASGGAEFQYFTPSNPAPVPLDRQRRGFAEGGVASIPTEGFDDLVQYFGATNPGAITASMYPTSPSAAPGAPAPAMRDEVIHSFARPARNATANNLGLGDMGGLYGNFGGFNAADYDAAISRLQNDLGFGSMAGPRPSAPPTMSAPQQMPVLDSVSNDYDFRGYIPDFAPTPMPIAQAPAPAPAPAPSIRPAPDAPPIMLSPFEGMDYGGPYYTDMPVMTEEAGFSPGYGGGGGRGMFDEFRVDQYAQGGAVDMRDGAFVVDARTVSELGNGSSNAGIEMLSRMGGRPVRGPGDGVSDSVRASIGGKQEARVARDEVIFQPEAVRRLGGGSDAKGTKKLYAMMEKAHKARKKAKRGQDTGVRKGLA